MTRLTLTEAHELAAAILRHAGFSEAFAQAIAATVTAGERDGCKSHGLWRLLGIVRTLKAGKAVADAEPEVIDQAKVPKLCITPLGMPVVPDVYVM